MVYSWSGPSAVGGFPNELKGNISVNLTYYPNLQKVTAIVTVSSFTQNDNPASCTVLLDAQGRDTSDRSVTSNSTLDIPSDGVTGFIVHLQWTGYGSFAQSTVFTLEQLEDTPLELLPQTIYVTGLTQNQNLIKGNLYNIILSGAQGTEYQASIVKGGGALYMTDSYSGLCTYSASQDAGPVQLKFWIAGNATYNISEYYYLNLNITPEKRIKITIPANKTKTKIVYRLVQGQTVLGEYVKEAGSGAEIVNAAVDANGGPVTLQTSVYDLFYEKNTWYDVKGAITELPPKTIEPVLETDPATAIPDPPVPTETPPSQTPPADAPIWTPNDNSEQTDNLSNATFREGVSQINAQLSKLKLGGDSNADILTNATYNTGNAAVVTKLSQINSTIDQGNQAAGQSSATIAQALNNLADTLSAQEVKRDVKLDEALAANPTTSEINANSQAAASEAASLMPSHQYAPSGFSPSGVSAPILSVQMPAQFGGVTFDLNPFREDRLGGMADWFRGAVAWLTIALFGYWASQEVAQWAQGFSNIKQASGNAVFGGTGGQATAAINAGIITVAFSTFIVALVSWLSGDFALTNILSKISTNPMSGMATSSLWMLEKFLPVSTIITAFVMKISWRFYAAKIFAIAAAVIRWAIA